MNKLLILPLMTLLIVGCKNNKEEVKAKEYDYSDVKELTVCWNNIFDIESENYYTYIYSETCGHCNEIKQQVISYALANYGSLYFVPFNKDIPIVDDPLIALEKDKIEDLGIVGTPSMFLITNHVIKKNIVGTKQIIETLTNE